MRRLDIEHKEYLKRHARLSYIRKIREKSNRIRSSIISENRLHLVKSILSPYGLPMPSDKNRIPIILPSVLSLSENYYETVKCIDMLRRIVLLQREPAIVYFDLVEKIEPSALLMLSAELYRCRHVARYTGGKSVTGRYPRSPTIFLQLRDFGFFKLIEVNGLDDLPDIRGNDPRPHFVRFQTATTVDARLAAQFCDMVLDMAFKMDDAAKRSMVAALKEAMGNAEEHAYSQSTGLPPLKGRWWISGYVNPTEKEMMLIVADLGIGIPRSLDPTIAEQIRALLARPFQSTDGATIELATHLHRTSTGLAGRGKGFRDMKRFVDACDDGALRIYSNHGSYSYTKSSSGFANESLSIGGTLIEWRVRNGAVVEVSDE